MKSEASARVNLEDARALLKEVFGFGDFRPGQEEIVAAMLAGDNLLAVMPTGAGKSLCYQAPALLSDGLTVVVSPLIALMDNQIAQLSALGAAAGVIHSNRPRADNVADWRRAAAGDLKLLYMAPERLMTERMLAALKDVGVARFVVDEAHCVSQWGHDFRPEYFALAKLREHFPGTPRAAFTATADERTRSDIATRLLGPDGAMHIHGFNRPNIDLVVTDKFDGKNQLIAMLGEHRGEQGIVYCLSRKETEEIAALLQGDGFNAVAYHAGLDAGERTDRLNRFLSEPDLVVAATVAFGMGIDKPDIRFVFHYAMPASIEAYYQEIGRAGRDGAPARAVMLYSGADATRRRRMVDRDTDDRSSEGARAEYRRLDDLIAYCEAVACRRQRLLDYFGETIEPCGGCDVCRQPPDLIDASAEAQLVIEAVEASGEVFGPSFIAEILRGADTKKIREKNADALSVYGAGKHKAAAFWRMLIRQMNAAGLLEIDTEYGGLKLNRARCADGAAAFKLRRQKTGAKARTRTSVDLGGADAGLLEALKQKRLELARERNVPAYVIFSDRTLIDMAKRRPETVEAFGDVFGVGAAKQREFAAAFLSVLCEFEDDDRAKVERGAA